MNACPTCGGDRCVRVDGTDRPEADDFHVDPAGVLHLTCGGMEVRSLRAGHWTRVHSVSRRPARDPRMGLFA